MEISVLRSHETKNIDIFEISPVSMLCLPFRVPKASAKYTGLVSFTFSNNLYFRPE